nr:MAG TPA: hypothetical protein [Caudoviricetes sp.]
MRYFIALKFDHQTIICARKGVSFTRGHFIELK